MILDVRWPVSNVFLSVFQFCSRTRFLLYFFPKSFLSHFLDTFLSLTAVSRSLIGIASILESRYLSSIHLSSLHLRCSHSNSKQCIASHLHFECPLFLPCFLLLSMCEFHLLNRLSFLYRFQSSNILLSL